MPGMLAVRGASLSPRLRHCLWRTKRRTKIHHPDPKEHTWRCPWCLCIRLYRICFARSSFDILCSNSLLASYSYRTPEHIHFLLLLLSLCQDCSTRMKILFSSSVPMSKNIPLQNNLSFQSFLQIFLLLTLLHCKPELCWGQY